MIRIVCLFLLVTVPALEALAQDSLRAASPNLSAELPDSVFRVGKIAITGNLSTKEFVIERELTMRIGMPITRRLLEYDQNRIYNLRLFTQVEIRVLPMADSLAMVLIEVHERWYVFPFPVFGIRDRDWEKVYYGFGILHDNFRGRNEKVYTTFVFGYDPSIRLTYRNPFLDESGSTFMELGFGFNKVKNRSLLAQEGIQNYDERHIGGSLTLGKRFGIEHTAWLSAGFEEITMSDVTPPRTFSPDGQDAYPLTQIGYSYDTRDLAEYPHQGSFARIAVSTFGLPGHDYNLIRYALDGRQFVRLWDGLVLGGRVFTDLAAAGPTPTYNRVYFGYGDRIRGHFKDVYEGESMLGASTELRLFLLEPVYFRVDFLPAQFGIWRFGIAATVFADAGTVWFRRNPVALDQFIRGYGFGLNLLLPYSTVARVEAAWNELRHGEIILDVGPSF